MNKLIQALRSPFYFIVWALLCVQMNAFASEDQASDNRGINLTDLGKFETQFTTLAPSQTIEGNKTMGHLVAKPQSGYQVSLPFDVQQSLFLVANGESVEKGDVIATINGVDVHHFIDEMAAAKTIYLNSKKYFQATKGSADTSTYKSAQWLAINKSFVEAKLNYEHFAHLEKVIQVDENDVISILSPQEGVINMNDLGADVLFEVIPTASLLVKAYLPVSNISGFNSLISEVEGCVLSTVVVEPVIKDYQQVIWSKGSKACQFTLGQSMVLVPEYGVQGFKVTRDAIFELDNQDYVAVKQGEKLFLEKVSIVGKQGRSLIIFSNKLSSETQILIASVSIAQGIFMGLGGE